MINKNQIFGYSLTSMILGICSIIFALAFTPIGLVCGIIGLVFAVKVRRTGEQNAYLKAGYICSIVGTIISAVILLISAIILFIFGFVMTSLLMLG